MHGTDTSDCGHFVSLFNPTLHASTQSRNLSQGLGLKFGGFTGGGEGTSTIGVVSGGVGGHAIGGGGINPCGSTKLMGLFWTSIRLIPAGHSSFSLLIKHFSNFFF